MKYKEKVSPIIYDKYKEGLKGCNLFKEAEKSTFSYWFAHWCAFQLIALNNKCWKVKYLFHDIEKPWMRLFMSYEKVKNFHRKYNSHHLEYGLIHGWNKIDWMALVIDWECSNLTKEAAQLDARDTMEYNCNKEKWKPYANEIKKYMNPILNKFGW